MIAECHDEIHGDAAAKTLEEKAVDHRALAEVALQKARRLRPNDGRVHLAQAYHFLRVVRDDEQARIEIDLARQTLPNSAELEQVGAIIAYRQARMDDALRMLEKAAALEPREAIVFTTLSWVYRSLRRYADFDRVAARLHELRPPEHKMYVRVDRAALALEERADLVPLREALATENPADPSAAEYLQNRRLTLAVHERDPDAILQALAAIEPTAMSGRLPKPWFEALAARLRGDDGAAQSGFAAAREIVAKRLESNPASAVTQSLLAVIDAGLGKAEDAERGALRGCEMADQRTNELGKLDARYSLAVVYSWIGQTDKALELLNMLVARPALDGPLYQPTYGTLRLDPVWDPLREEPRFAAVVDRLAPGKASGEIAETRR